MTIFCWKRFKAVIKFPFAADSESADDAMVVRAFPVRKPANFPGSKAESFLKITGGFMKTRDFGIFR